eukprot:3885838-Lingulodinium_polyedra.AAC.1
MTNPAAKSEDGNYRPTTTRTRARGLPKAPPGSDAEGRARGGPARKKQASGARKPAMGASFP